LSKLPLIAVVDDDEAVREALCDLLQVEGFAARPFENGAVFLADAAAGSCDCLITDVRMPEMDGLELQRQLTARGSAMPVIFITSSSDEKTRTRALEGGAFAWFGKPATDEALLGALRAALDRSGGFGGTEPSGD